MSVLWQEHVAAPVVPLTTFRRYLRLPPRRDYSEAIVEAEQWARDWFHAHARAWTCAVVADNAFQSWLAARQPGLGTVAIVAASAGPEAEAEAAARWQNEEPDRYYFLECYAAAAVDQLVADARMRLGASRHHCPGYPGWPVEDNRHLHDALRRTTALPGPLQVLESGMLKPKKSQLAICALAEVQA